MKTHVGIIQVQSFSFSLLLQNSNENNVWQKPLQYCKVISLQKIKKNEKKKKKERKKQGKLKKKEKKENNDGFIYLLKEYQDQW